MTDLTVKTSSQNVNRIIGNVKRTAGAYNNYVQEAIVAVIEHSKNYNDCTGAARLLDAMPQSNRRQLVVDHFAQYSPINVTRGKTGAFKATLRKPHFDKAETKPDTRYNDYNLEGVRANNWFERPEAEKLPDVINYDSIRSSVLKFIESSLKKAEKCEDDADKQMSTVMLRTLRSAASDFNAKIDQPVVDGADEPEMADVIAA